MAQPKINIIENTETYKIEVVEDVTRVIIKPADSVLQTLRDEAKAFAEQTQADAAQVALLANQAIQEKRADFVSPFSYIGTAERDSLESDPVWTINRIEVFEDGTTDKKTATNVAWTDRLTVNYN